MSEAADHPDHPEQPEQPEPKAPDPIQQFLSQAGDVAKTGYEQLRAYAESVAEPLNELTVKAARAAEEASPDHELLVAGAKAFTDAGAIFFQLANRALYANAEAARAPGGVAAESAKFFRQLGMLWLDSTVGEGTATTGFTGTDRIREVEFRDVVAGEVTERTVSIVSRSGKETNGKLVRSDLIGSSDVRISVEHIKILDEHSSPIRDGMTVAPGRTPITVVVDVPEGTPQGRYRGLLSVYAGDVESSLVLTVVVTGAPT
jgi:hypothetical protein